MTSPPARRSWLHDAALNPKDQNAELGYQLHQEHYSPQGELLDFMSSWASIYLAKRCTAP